MEKNQGSHSQMVALHPISYYAGRSHAAGELFHVEQKDHEDIFLTMQTARPATPEEIEAERAKVAAAAKAAKLAAAEAAKQKDKPAAGVQAELGTGEGAPGAESKEGEHKDLRAGRPNGYKTRDMAVETGGDRVTKGE